MSKTRARAAVAVLLLTLLMSSGCAATVPASEVGLDPSATPFPAAPVRMPSAGETAPASVPAPVIVTIGDSIMAGYGLDPGEDWPTLLADRTGVPVTNLACSGAGFIADGDCGSDFAGLIDAAIAAHPTMVILQSSDNDDGQSDADLDNAAMTTVVALRAALPDARIVGLSTLWNQPYDAPDEIVSSTIALQTAVDAVGGTFVDIGQPLQNGQDLMQFDDEHPTAAGQQVLLDAITSALAGAGIYV
ncbi:SGNH/GDSL hydrolase family protein [Microbacterium rhizomatis]|uniref:SGNH/GDSL hydrolase family protein n=1 Tax=Microbacterium rhizomatis TaxID=1631477 RepID=A0A5J5J3X4_9MICO|nr:SGNH/GDSL hydrolase family protein [Microbacterium rhizomatis]KAA9110776.1 SGNH/GDSL hydrolase family protein [Microbacterium rhizomatis]